MNESELRDILADHLDVLGPGLTLIDKEAHIPNPLGTTGFIDLYAKNDQHRHVLIELKRSDSSAREAIHELYKYVQGVKQLFAVKDEEIEVIVASTTWRELAVPFSALLSTTNWNLSAIQLTVTANHDLRGHRAELPEVVPNRAISQIHDVLLYRERGPAYDYLEEARGSLEAKGVSDYILVHLSRDIPAATPNPKEKSHPTRKLFGSLQNEYLEIPVYSHIAYVAIKEMTEDLCLAHIMRCDEATYEELSEILVDEEDVEVRLQLVHEYLVASEPRPIADSVEIGYPAKFDALVESGLWEVITIERGGRFAKNAVLTDEVLLSEIAGDDGRSGARAVRTFNPKSRSEVIAAREAALTALSDNVEWTSHLKAVFSEIETSVTATTAHLSVFAPTTGLSTFYFCMTRPDGVLYIPEYHVIVEYSDGGIVSYFGILESKGASVTLDELLAKYYEGDIFQLALTLTWGGYEQQDSMIMWDLGVSYRSYRCHVDGDIRTFEVWSNGRWIAASPIDHISSFFNICEERTELIDSLIDALGSSNGVVK